jgi:aspartyl-tRNA(Asn)/glutamyl-tRNA(Gln) amidotransferase subunit C
MKIDDKTLDKIASLAKLEIAESEREKLKSDMSAILDWVEKLNELDTENTAAITQMTSEINRLRDDEQVKNFSNQQALQNAREKSEGFFVVPKVIKK